MFALEASRLARNNRDWYHLVDLCGLTSTLIIDAEGVYDPHHFNDRLLLGLKGTMSEWELGVMRQRSLVALREKAERGELYTTLPIGLLRTRDDRCELDPDRRIRRSIGLVFEKFEQLGSIRQVLLWFRQEGVELPAVEYGPFGHGVVWKLPVECVDDRHRRRNNRTIGTEEHESSVGVDGSDAAVPEALQPGALLCRSRS